MPPRPEQVDALFARWDRPDSPGCALGIVQDGELIYERGYGLASLEYAVPITADSVFLVASTSKQFVAACALLLAQQSGLGLDDDVRRYLPELPRYPWPITLRHLVHHTSGLREEGLLFWFAGQKLEDTTNADMLALITRQQRLNSRPGDAHAYCNSGYTLLAEIIQRVSGQTLRAFAHDQLFGPLGMGCTRFDDDHTEVVPHRVSSYSPRPGGGYARHLKTHDTVGPGGLLTTIRDLCRWDENFYTPTVGGPGFLAQLLARGRLNDGCELNYAGGLVHGQYRGLPYVHHGGQMLGFRSEMVRFPEQRFTVICLANVNPFNPIERAFEVANLYLTDAFTEPAPPAGPLRQPAAAELEGQLGLYHDAETGMYARLCLAGEQLMAEVMGNALPIGAAVPAGEGPAYRSLPGVPHTIEIRLRRPATEQPWNMHVTAGMHTLPVMRRVEAAPVSAGDLAQCAGDYYSDELQAMWRFSVEAGRLRGGIKHGPDGVFEPGPPGTLLYGGFSLQFERDSAGRPVALVLNDARARHLRFARRQP
jgi:CubicO group peptidase (beta-lactamase class C family)